MTYADHTKNRSRYAGIALACAVAVAGGVIVYRQYGGGPARVERHVTTPAAVRPSAGMAGTGPGAATVSGPTGSQSHGPAASPTGQSAPSTAAGATGARAEGQPAGAGKAKRPTLDELSAAFERDMQRVREQRQAAAVAAADGAASGDGTAAADDNAKNTEPRAPQVLPGNPFRRPGPPGKRPHQVGPVHGENAPPVGGAG